MPILSPFLERRAYRAIDSKPIDEEVLTRLAEAAVTAPSANNSQPWRFITVTDPAVLAEVHRQTTASHGVSSPSPTLPFLQK